MLLGDGEEIWRCIGLSWAPILWKEFSLWQFDNRKSTVLVIKAGFIWSCCFPPILSGVPCAYVIILLSVSKWSKCVDPCSELLFLSFVGNIKCQVQSHWGRQFLVCFWRVICWSTQCLVQVEVSSLNMWKSCKLRSRSCCIQLYWFWQTG